jgi:hypothetical protein
LGGAAISHLNRANAWFLPERLAICPASLFLIFICSFRPALPGWSAPYSVVDFVRWKPVLIPRFANTGRKRGPFPKPYPETLGQVIDFYSSKQP